MGRNTTGRECAGFGPEISHLRSEISNQLKNMTLKYKLYAAAAMLIAVLIIGNAVRSHVQITKLERAVDQTKHLADEQLHRSDELEKQTYIYKEKAAYLEARLGEIQTAARKQDEQLEKLSADTVAARSDLKRHRNRSK